MTVKYLITGVTGSLGQAVAQELLKHVPASTIVLTSTRASKEEELQLRFPGTTFRVFSYDNLEEMDSTLSDVQRFFFVSTNTTNVPRRTHQHSNVVSAAKKAGIQHTYYTSLAMGKGYETSTVNRLMDAHIETERLLEQSGLSYTAVRCGLYLEAFPVYLGWYPTSKEIYLPSRDGVPQDGPVSWAKISEIGEAIAIIMAAPAVLSFKETNNIALLSGPAAYTLADLTTVLSVATPASPTSDETPVLEYIPDDEYPAFMEKYDSADGRGQKDSRFYHFWLTIQRGLLEGEGAPVSPLLETILERKPKDGLELARELSRVAASLGEDMSGIRTRTL